MNIFDIEPVLIILPLNPKIEDQQFQKKQVQRE